MDHPILAQVREIGGEVFENGDYNLNIIGIRKKNGTPNHFDDELHCIFKVDGQWRDLWWPITTDPGTYWLNHPMNPAGTAAVVADRQYKGVWKLGKHRNTYVALVQTGAKILVHRDDNLDNKVDYRDDNIREGFYGINCHRATTSAGGSVAIDKWSAGCQVFAKPNHYAEFIAICQKQSWKSFTYTLLNEW